MLGNCKCFDQFCVKTLPSLRGQTILEEIIQLSVMDGMMIIPGQKSGSAGGTDPQQYRYGLSKELSVSGKESDHTFVLAGVGKDGVAWKHVMTRRAAQVLWCRLTELLYPDKAEMVTSMVATAPLTPTGLGSLTTHVEVVKSDTNYTLVGRVERSRWIVQVEELELRRLWATLDVALYPVGWEGRKTKTKKLN